MTRRISLLAILTMVLCACNFPAPAGAPVETPPPVSAPTQPVAPATSTSAQSATAFDVASLDLCSLVDPASVEAALGEAATPSSGPGACVFVGASGTQSVTLAVLSGEAATGVFLSSIAQLQTDCSVGFTLSSGETPTPFAPEIQAMAGRPLADLIAAQEEVQREQCGFSPGPEQYQRLEGLGDAAYFQLLDLGFVQSGIVVVVRGSTYLSVTYAAPTVDPAMARTVTESLAREALPGLP